MTERCQTSAQIARLEARVAVLEQVIFQFNPSALRPNIDSVEAVKNFLRKHDIEKLSPHVARFLSDQLPVDWRALANSAGAIRTFKLLVQNVSIIDARRKLA
ncbi:hypothetical protein ABIB83_005460 [Bradyrhizobium sp. I1.8.5]|uniref:hypothetical protein n=1 Tax=Bradyrhizobium sp. I1.8.5 TaxID=3156365 RepID=UPI003395C40A